MLFFCLTIAIIAIVSKNINKSVEIFLMSIEQIYTVVNTIKNFTL